LITPSPRFGAGADLLDVVHAHELLSNAAGELAAAVALEDHATAGSLSAPGWRAQTQWRGAVGLDRECSITYVMFTKSVNYRKG
jgi:hypothetical protein